MAPTQNFILSREELISMKDMSPADMDVLIESKAKEARAKARATAIFKVTSTAKKVNKKAAKRSRDEMESDEEDEEVVESDASSEAESDADDESVDDESVEDESVEDESVEDESVEDINMSEDEEEEEDEDEDEDEEEVAEPPKKKAKTEPKKAKAKAKAKAKDEDEDEDEEEEAAAFCKTVNIATEKADKINKKTKMNDLFKQLLSVLVNQDVYNGLLIAGVDEDILNEEGEVTKNIGAYLLNMMKRIKAKKLWKELTSYLGFVAIYLRIIAKNRKGKKNQEERENLQAAYDMIDVDVRKMATKACNPTAKRQPKVDKVDSGCELNYWKVKGKW